MVVRLAGIDRMMVHLSRVHHVLMMFFRGDRMLVRMLVPLGVMLIDPVGVMLGPPAAVMPLRDARRSRRGPLQRQPDRVRLPSRDESRSTRDGSGLSSWGCSHATSRHRANV